MIRIVIIAALIIALMFLLNSYKRSSAEGRRKILKALLFSALGLALIALVVTGRLNWLVALVGSLVPLLPKFFSWLIRYAPSLMALFKKYKLSGKGKSTKTVHGQQSQVNSVYLVMTLDHDTGGIDGKVIKGEFKGRLLSQMTLQELRKMLHDCDDDETISLLMTYMDRYNRRHSSHGDGHRDENNERPDFMSIHEAREILGVSEDAKSQEIIEAHRHLIQKLHPDRGGSEYLAMKINRAKDLLLGEM